MLATCAFRIADALELHGSAADAEWNHLAAVIVHAGKDPNWRRQPSILDQFRGWKILPSSRIRRSTTASGLNRSGMAYNLRQLKEISEPH
jgi:hypothetical protein